MSRRWSDVVDLIPLIDGESLNGYLVETEGKARLGIYANKKDVHSVEFYQASAQGVQLETMFEVHSIDYKGEELLKYEENSYEIKRTYDRGEITELICRKRGADHAS